MDAEKCVIFYLVEYLGNFFLSSKSAFQGEKWLPRKIIHLEGLVFSTDID